MKSRAEYHRKWRKANPDKVKASELKRRERKLAYNKAYDASHPERRPKERVRKWRAANPEKARESYRRNKRASRRRKLLATIKANMLKRHERRLARKKLLRRIIAQGKS